MILIVGDGNTLADSFQDALVFGGYRVLHAESGHDARAMLRTCRPDLVVLELMLPDADGLVLLDDLRNLTRVPVLVCSDTRRKQDRVLALRLGAQEFLAQPVTSDELRTCVRAVLERTPASRADGRHPELLRFGDLVIDQTRRSISLRDRPVHVTPTEYRLLHALGSRPCQVLTYDELVRLVWQYRDSSRATHMMHSHMSRLRAKLEGCRDAAIVAVRGFGYMLDVAEKHRTTRPGDVDLNLV